VAEEAHSSRLIIKQVLPVKTFEGEVESMIADASQE
jgi:hypothetical protein